MSKPKKKAAPKKAPKGKAASKELAEKVPKGGRLSAAKKAVRDSLMLQRRAEGRTWPEIAAEFGLAESTCKEAVRSRKEVLPELLNMDPLEIVGHLVEGFQASVSVFEVMAMNYADNHPSAAVGAKKAANDARKQLAQLLQSTGTLPRELGTLRHLVDIRAISVELVSSVKNFEEAIRALDLPKDQRQAALEAAEGVRATLEKVAGEDEAEAVPNEA